MFAVLFETRWITNIPADEAAVFLEEGYRVVRMDIFNRLYNP